MVLSISHGMVTLSLNLHQLLTQACEEFVSATHTEKGITL